MVRAYPLSKLNLERLFSTTNESMIRLTSRGQIISSFDSLEISSIEETFYSELTKLDEKVLRLDIIFTKQIERMSRNYKCYAYNQLGHSEASVDVENEVLNFSKDIELFENFPLMLACQISGVPQPSIIWYKNKRQIYENGSVKLVNSDRHLTIAEACGTLAIIHAKQLINWAIN